MTSPRVLLLQENHGHGGVGTISRTLCRTLRMQGWQVEELALSNVTWSAQLRAARQADVILASNNFKSAYSSWILGLLLQKNVVVWVHGPVQEVLQQAQASVFKRVWVKWVYQRLKRFVFVSQASKDSFERLMGHTISKHHRLTVIPNVVELAAWGKAAPEVEVSRSGQIPLAFIGRLSAEKRPQLLVEMLRLLPSQFTLTLVGSGPLQAELHHQGQDLIGDGRLRLVGQQAHGASLYTPWRLTVLASRYEGCPMTLLESFAAGVPCVGLPIAALEEVVQTDAPYLLATTETAQALADAVLAVCAMPIQQVHADMARVLERYQVQDFVLAWQSVLQEAATSC